MREGRLGGSRKAQTDKTVRSFGRRGFETLVGVERISAQGLGDGRWGMEVSAGIFSAMDPTYCPPNINSPHNAPNSLLLHLRCEVNGLNLARFYPPPFRPWRDNRQPVQPKRPTGPRVSKNYRDASSPNPAAKEPGLRSLHLPTYPKLVSPGPSAILQKLFR